MNKTKVDILGYGISCVDYTALVEKIPKSDETINMLDFFRDVGGPVTVALNTFSALGGEAAYLGVIGRDDNGVLIKRSFKKFRINIDAIIEEKSSQSPCSIILVEKKNAKRAIIFNPGCAFNGKFTDFRINEFKEIKYLYLDGVNTKEAINAAQWAKENNITVVLDAGVFTPEMVKLIKKTDIVIASYHFLKEFSKESNIKNGIKEIKELGPGLAVVTKGSKGSYAYDGKNYCYQAAFKIKPVDTTGAGDVFHGAFLFGLTQSWNLKKILEFASATAAIKIMRTRDNNSIPKYNEVIKFLRNYSIKY